MRRDDDELKRHEGEGSLGKDRQEEGEEGQRRADLQEKNAYSRLWWCCGIVYGRYTYSRGEVVVEGSLYEFVRERILVRERVETAVERQRAGDCHE